jgi:hypothetical protein
MANNYGLLHVPISLSPATQNSYNIKNSARNDKKIDKPKGKQLQYIQSDISRQAYELKITVCR